VLYESPPEEEKATSIEAGCVPCIPPKTLIWANPSLKTIEELSIGDFVMSSDGKYNQIESILKRPYKGNLISITVPYQTWPILVTPEHPILAIEAKGCKADRSQTLCYPKENPKCQKCQFYKKYQPEWTPAKDISAIGKRNSWPRHIVLMPILSITKDITSLSISEIAQITPPFIRNKVKAEIAINEDFMKLAGYYLAEGSVNFRKRGTLLRFDFGPTEDTLAQDAVKLLNKIFSVKAKVVPEETSLRVQISSLLLGHFFNNLFGSGANQKQLPGWVLSLPTYKQIALLYGFWLGDGSWHKSYGRDVMAAGTSSRNLAFGLRVILHRLGIIHNLTYTKTRPSKINGRLIQSGKDIYVIQINSNGTARLSNLLHLPINYRFVQSSKGGIDAQWVYLPVKKVTEIPYNGIVMNLETTKQTYCAEGVIVHNCAIGHLGTCSGLLAESLRFGRKDGIDSGEVIDRANLCLDELNAMERVDLRPELIVGLPEWEKKLANQALDESRAVRHSLEGLSTVEELEKVAARVQTARQEIGRNWFKEKLTKMPKEEKSELVEKTIEKLEGEE